MTDTDRLPRATAPTPSDTADIPAHTPGPWSFDHDFQRLPTVFAADGRTIVAYVCGGGKHDKISRAEATANAALIVAAEDMLAALEAILDDHSRTYAVRAAEGRRALAKARGASQ